MPGSAVAQFAIDEAGRRREPMRLGDALIADVDDVDVQRGQDVGDQPTVAAPPQATRIIEAMTNKPNNVAKCFFMI